MTIDQKFGRTLGTLNPSLPPLTETPDPDAKMHPSRAHRATLPSVSLVTSLTPWRGLRMHFSQAHPHLNTRKSYSYRGSSSSIPRHPILCIVLIESILLLVVREALEPAGNTLDLASGLVHNLWRSSTHHVLADLVVYKDQHLLENEITNEREIGDERHAEKERKVART